ncbi:MAG: hypothetical protein AB1473_01880 [Thermodesulfobacteriota bacterium]
MTRVVSVLKGVSFGLAVLLLLMFPVWGSCQGDETPQIAPVAQAQTGSTNPSAPRDRATQASARVGDPRGKTVSGPSRNQGQSSGISASATETVAYEDAEEVDLLSRDPLRLLRLENIKPLYTDPLLEGEGIWESASSPKDPSGEPIVYRTFYRSSVQFPNAIVYMMVVDMSKVAMRYYVGSQEPAANAALSRVEPQLLSRIMAVTNAMWMQRHSQGAGAIFRGKILYPMVDGMATLIIFKDGSVDIQEWSSDIPQHLVLDARQLRHLIVKNGLVVRAVVRKDRLEDSEIGLGFLLGHGAKSVEGEHAWYVAHRSAFGIREDGNLVFAIGHHVGTKDMAKALVLAGCERAIHGDANPANIVGNLYLRDSTGNLLRKLRLSPEQSKYTLERYENGYTKDFFVFFSNAPGSAPVRSLTKRNPPAKRRTP